MTNFEKLQTGTKEEVKIILLKLAYRSDNYSFHDIQVQKFMDEEVKVNHKGKIIL